MKDAMIVLNTMIDDKDVKAHCLSAGMLYVRECNNLGILYNEEVLNTVILHDIGKSNKLKGDSIAEKGYNYLKQSPKVYARSIRNMGTGRHSAECNEIETLITTVIDYCDSHTDYRGNFCNITDKLQEIGTTCGMFSEEYKQMLNVLDYYFITDCDIPATIKKLDLLLRAVK